MRALKGLAMQWLVCFALLAVIGILPLCCLVARSASFADAAWTLLEMGICASLAILCFSRMLQNLKYWIRMALAMYEAIDDLGFAGGERSGNEG